MEKHFTYNTKFKITWAEGKTGETGKYIKKEFNLPEFAYIITKRHHELALENIRGGFYGCYDKHGVQVNYGQTRENLEGEWEELGRMDLGNDTDFKFIVGEFEKDFKKPGGLYTYSDTCWSDLVQHGLEDIREKYPELV